MKLHFYFLVALLLLGGCSVASLEDDFRSSPGLVVSKSEGGKKQLSNIGQVRMGMSYQEVMAVMGATAKIGYSVNPDSPESYASVPVKNPYRAEMLKVGKKRYQVIYFFTQIKQADGEVSDDELTPVVLEDNQVMAKGWNDLVKLKGGLLK